MELFVRNLAPFPLPLSLCAYGDKLCVGEFLLCCIDFYVTPYNVHCNKS